MAAMLRAEINGEPAKVQDLHRLATVNYGHYSTMQVRGGAVAGLELHLDRLAASSRELFGIAVDTDLVRTYLRQAISGAPDASVRVTVFGGNGRRHPIAITNLNVLVSVGDPASAEPGSDWRLRTTTYQRDLPHIKHVATLGLIRHWRSAIDDGFDDALFVSQDGLVSEGTAWNLALWDGERVVWPDAPQLSGITMQVLRQALTATGVAWTSAPVHRADLPAFTGAATTYSTQAGRPVASIDEVHFGQTDELVKVLRQAWKTVVWDRI
jgi:branched-subunit amino acid aminotransferase/4-amino-4-deoxychorismate lyase